MCLMQVDIDIVTEFMSEYETESRQHRIRGRRRWTLRQMESEPVLGLKNEASQAVFLYFQGNITKSDCCTVHKQFR